MTRVQGSTHAQADELAAACVGSTFSARQTGGLTTLVARLLPRLTEYQWSWIARVDGDGFGATDYAAGGPEGRSSASGWETRIVGPANWMRPLLARVGWTIFQPGGLRTAPGVWEAAYGRSVARQFPPRPSVVLWAGTGIELMGYTLERAARRSGAPFLVLPALHPGEWGDAPIDGQLYRRAQAVLALTHAERDVLVRLGVDAGRVHILRPGPTVDSGGDAQRFRRRYGLDERPIVAFIGRRTRAKGLPQLGAAVRQLIASGLRCVLAVAGPPGDAPTDTARHVLDLGICDEQTKADLLAACDVFALPSSSEAFGLVYLDAWAYGKPVIAGPSPAVAELVRDGIDGVRTAQDVVALTAALDMLLQDDSRRLQMGAAGRQHQADTFTWEAAACAFRRAVIAARRLEGA